MTPRHVMILASAGSGKTYALTNRFVGLLAEGAAPERIVALTFTRKAAGEFFDEIVHKLADGAADPGSAARLAGDLSRPDLGQEEFRRMLRAVIDAMPRLRLGTLDGFFGRIARAFPGELGLAGPFEVLSEHAARLARAGVLQRLFVRAPEGLAGAQREFIEAFKRATFGAEEKRLAGRLDAFLDEHHETYLDAPDAALWGDAARIWPRGSDWLAAPARERSAAAAALQAALAARGLPDRQRDRWAAFFAALPECAPGSPLPKPVEYVARNAFAVWEDLVAGGAEITIERRKCALGPVEAAALVEVVRHLVSGELMRRLETTRGIHAVLRGYDAGYHERVRRAGRLTFADVQRLLRPEASGLALAGAAGEGRLRIDFRLDAQFDHWLLDEFQDTSFGQWSVLRNLIDEAVQDPSGRRTFFCVGDVKQAIYTWRAGDPRLFREILDHYNAAAPGTIAEEHLVQSWRSGPAVIAMVNAVFGAGAVLGRLFPGTAAATWNREWRAHSSARPGLAGHAAWLLAPDDESSLALTVAVLREVDPVGRGLSCAVLTQTNAAATLLAEHLRQVGAIPALAESDLHVATDNPLGAALLALLQAAAHPGDTLAAAHVAMSPLGAALSAAGVRTPSECSARILAQVHDDGFERTVEYWLARAEGALDPADAFSRERARQFVAAAALFDASGSRDVAEFVAFMERHAVRGTEMAGVVRVMTIHKAKGLGFDVVVLPDLDGQRLDQRRAGLAVQRAADRTVEWILDLPGKLYYERDETLAAHVRHAEAEAGYEAIALLYVAMTRAKRGMYVISKAAGESESRNYPRLLADTLGEGPVEVAIGGWRGLGAWQAGNDAWLAATEREPAAMPGPAVPPLDLGTARRAVRRVVRRPSLASTAPVEVARLFSLEGGSARDFGEAVHALLSEVEGPEPGWPERWRARGEAEDVVAEAAGCLAAPALAEVWECAPGTRVWRERAFEIVLDDAWVTGVFDRVVVRHGPDGRAREAVVYDFKTERLAEGADLAAAARRHALQVGLYRRVAAVLTGLPEAAVRAEIVFTALRRRGPAGA